MLKLSSSSIGTYEKCPKQYQYRYIIKPDIPAKDWDFLEFGKCAHETLEYFHIHLMKNVVEPSKYNKVMSASLKKAIVNYKMEIIKPDFLELKGVLQDYLDRVKKDGLPPVLDVEMSFSFMFHGVLLRGFIDRLDRLGLNEFHVNDYKTNKKPKYLKPFQLKLYALAVKNKYPEAKVIHGSYILLKHKSRTKDWTFTEDDLEETKERILGVGRDITLGKNWEKKPTILCNWCDYKEICQGPSLSFDDKDDSWTGDAEKLLFK